MSSTNLLDENDLWAQSCPITKNCMTKEERGLQNINKHVGQVLKRYDWEGSEIPERNTIITNPSYCSPSPCPSQRKKKPGSFGNHEDPQCIRSGRYQNRFPCFHIINLKDLQKKVRHFIFLIMCRKHHCCYLCFIINLHATMNAILSAWTNISQKNKVFKRWLRILQLNQNSCSMMLLWSITSI